MVSHLKKHLTHQFNHLIYLHLLLRSRLVRFYESIHQPHKTSLYNSCVNIYIFSCINAYLGLFYHHPWYKCLNEFKDVQIRLIYVPVFNSYLQFFLPSPLQMQVDISLNSLGILFFTEKPQQGKKKSTGSVWGTPRWEQKDRKTKRLS